MTKQAPTIDLLKSYIRKCEESLESTTDYALLGALDRRIELLRYAIECIEKQIPKKPRIEYMPLFKAYCPICEGRLLPSKWCAKCGQAILWESDNE